MEPCKILEMQTVSSLVINGLIDGFTQSSEIILFVLR